MSRITIVIIIPSDLVEVSVFRRSILDFLAVVQLDAYNFSVLDYGLFDRCGILYLCTCFKRIFFEPVI